MVKEILWPRSGALQGGCAAPWDLEKVINTALKTQKGSPELAWHLVNFDFDKYFAGCSPNGVTDMSDIRYYSALSASSVPARWFRIVSYNIYLLYIINMYSKFVFVDIF